MIAEKMIKLLVLHLLNKDDRIDSTLRDEMRKDYDKLIDEFIQPYVVTTLEKSRTTE